MKIGNPADKRNVAATENAASPAKATAEAAKQAGVAGAAADPSAKVELSSAANLMAGASTADFDAERSSASRKRSPTAATRSTPS